MNRAQSQNSSQGNTIDMVRLVKRREENRVSKMNNFREVYGRYYDDGDRKEGGRGERMLRKYYDQRENSRGNYQKYSNKNKQDNNNKYQLTNNGQQLQNLQSPSYQPPISQTNPLSPSTHPLHSTSHRHHLQSTNRQSIFRPSQIHLLNDIDSSPRNRVIGWLLMVIFVIMYLQFVIVCGYFFNQSYFVYSDDERIRVYDQEGRVKEVVKDSGRISQYVSGQFQLLSTSTIFTTALFIYSLAQCMYHLLIYWINNKSINNNSSSNNRVYNNTGSTLLIDPQTSTLSYILHCRDFTRQSNTFITKLIKSPKFTLLVIVLSVILSCYGSVVCFYYSQLNYFWVDFLIQQQADVYSIFQVILFVIILPDVMLYLFFERMHVVNNDNNFSQHYNQSLKQPFTSQFQQSNHINKSLPNHHQLQHFQNNNKSFTTINPPLTTFNTNKWYLKLSLIILLISIIYSIITTKYWLAIVAIAKIELLFVKSKYRIDTFWVQLWAKVVVFVVTGGLLGYQAWVNSYSDSIDINLQAISTTFTYISYPITLSTTIFITIITIISLLLTRLLASHYLRQQLYKHLFQQMSIISYTIIGSFIFTYLFYKYIMDFVQVDYFSVIIIVVIQICLLVGIWQQGKQREQIEFDCLQRQSENVVEMQTYV